VSLNKNSPPKKGGFFFVFFVFLKTPFLAVTEEEKEEIEKDR
jgi:hypothetical protein